MAIQVMAVYMYMELLQKQTDNKKKYYFESFSLIRMNKLKKIRKVELMKKKLYILLHIGLLLLFTACQKAPKEVLENVKNVDKTVQAEKNLDYDTLENIYKTIDGVKSNTYDNLIFSSNFSINMPKSIGSLSFKQAENFYKKNKSLFKKFVKDINGDVKIDTEVHPPGMVYDDVEGKETFSLCENGFFYYEKYKYESWLNVENGNLDSYTLIDEIFLRKDKLDQTFEWKNNTFSLNDIIETATIYSKELSSTYDGMDWIPESIEVYQHKGGEFFFQVSFIKSYHDVHIFYSDWKNKADSVKEPYVEVYQPIMVIDSALEVILVDNYPGVIEYVKTKETYDKIITLAHAMEKLSSHLSSYRKYEVQWISLEYRLVLESSEVLDKDDLSINEFAAGSTYQTRPCWTIYLDNNSNKSVFAMVDCVTGEVEFVCNN
jgi:hypothetical protein